MYIVATASAASTSKSNFFVNCLQCKVVCVIFNCKYLSQSRKEAIKLNLIGFILFVVIIAVLIYLQRIIRCATRQCDKGFT